MQRVQVDLDCAEPGLEPGGNQSCARCCCCNETWPDLVLKEDIPLLFLCVGMV